MNLGQPFKAGNHRRNILLVAQRRLNILWLRMVQPSLRDEHDLDRYPGLERPG
jgi:hypothetical protein